MEKVKNNTDFWVECNVCKQHLKNWVGSTPCCGSIAFVIENGIVTKKITLFGLINDKHFEPMKL